MRRSPETVDTPREADEGADIVVLLDDVRRERQIVNRLDYVADMAGQLAQLAEDGGHQRLALLLALATDEARAAAAVS